MATLITLPKFRAFDADGNPLAGGKVYTYEAGTTTPKATYTDADAGTPNSNPVILDSQGYASIWGVGTYKVVIKNSADATLQTIDDVGIPGLPAVDGGGADTGKLVIVSGSEYALTSTLTDFKMRGVNRQVQLYGSIPNATISNKVYFATATRLHSIKPFTASGAVTLAMSKNGSTTVLFGVSSASTVAVTTTPATTAVNMSGTAYIDLAAGDYLQVTTSSSTATDLIIPLNTTENYS